MNHEKLPTLAAAPVVRASWGPKRDPISPFGADAEESKDPREVAEPRFAKRLPNEDESKRGEEVMVGVEDGEADEDW